MSILFKKLLALLIAALLILILNKIYGHVKNAFNTPASNKIVVIDAGHGGWDSGAAGKGGLREKGVNLEIAKRLKRHIEESGGVAIMIREDDSGLYSADSPNRKRQDMRNRKQIIKESNADIFLSIHLNSFPQAQYYGAQVFYPKDSKNSQWLAKILQQELRRVLNKNNDRVEKSSDQYFILKENGITSVLVECGFLSNPEEERLLGLPEYQEKIAWSIYIGILRFFNEPVPAEIKEK
jgi:N-acetylmuramoyl-L-alanine amidase